MRPSRSTPPGRASTARYASTPSAGPRGGWPPRWWRGSCATRAPASRPCLRCARSRRAARDNRLYHALVGGDARVLGVESRTSTDSYNVFAVNPGVSAQAVVAGPGSGNAESPSGWLLPATRFRIQTDVNISGNNVNAYLDTDHNNKPD